MALLLATCLGVAVFAATPALGEDAPRRVGSLDYISGEVTYVLRGEPGEPNEADTENWLRADFDQPVCQDMSLRTGALARARVSIGPDAIEMSDDTWLNLLNLNDQLIEASIRYGRIYLQLGKIDPGESIELEMPRGSLWLLQPGAYDIEIGDGGQPTRIVVFEGKARFVGGAADMPVDAGKFIEITGNYPAVATVESDWTGPNPAKAAAATKSPASAPDGAAPATAVSPVSEPPSGTVSAQTPAAPPNAPAADDQLAAPSGTAADRGAQSSATDQTQFTASNAPADAEGSGAIITERGQKASDDFLFWVEQSNEYQQQQTPRQTQYVSAETTGADDLDRYGRWNTVPDAGPVWFPTSVPADWAPYRFGHWDWIEPWGWTWIDDQPWGFAPFHYGRWVNIDGHWGWAPGAVDPHPVYAPALVAFVDAPADSGAGPDGGPDVGWFPLGPGDDYAPWYQAGPNYVAAVNAPEHGHFHDQRSHSDGGEPWRGAYFNRRFATVVSRYVFTDARRIDRDTVRRIDAERLDQAAVMRGAPHATPAVFRAPAVPGEFRGEPRGAAPAAVGASGLHARPGGVRGPQREPGIAARDGLGYERTPHTFGRSQAHEGMAAGYRGNTQQFARPEVSQGFRSMTQFRRPQVFQTPAASYRGVGMIGRPAPTAHFTGGGRGVHRK